MLPERRARAESAPRITDGPNDRSDANAAHEDCRAAAIAGVLGP
jgi:hypothetical protein